MRNNNEIYMYKLVRSKDELNNVFNNFVDSILQ